MSQINDKLYTFDAQYQLDDFAEVLNINPPQSSYHTLGGWIIENIKTIPQDGDSFEYENLLVIVDEVTDRRVKKVKIEIQESETKDSPLSRVKHLREAQ